MFLGAIGESHDSNNPWATALTLEGNPVILLIDTGAEVTVISKMWKVVGRPDLSMPDRTLPWPGLKHHRNTGEVSRYIPLPGVHDRTREKST